MFKKILIVLIIFSLSLSAFAKTKYVESHKTSTSMIIDGLNAEWKNVNFYNHKNYKVDYSFQNDNDFLYIFFKFNDPKFISSLNMTGFTIWINNKGKKKRGYGIKFKRIMVKPEFYISLMEKKIGKIPESQKKEMLKKPFYKVYESVIVAKDSEDSIPIKVHSKLMPAFKMAFSRNSGLSLEFKIPLIKKKGEIAGIGIKPGEDVVIGFEWGGMTKEMKNMMRKRKGGYQSYSGRGGVSSDLPGGSEMDQGQLSSSSTGNYNRGIRGYYGPKKYRFWVKVKTI